MMMGVLRPVLGFSASGWLSGRSLKPLGSAPGNIETPNDKNNIEQTKTLPLERWARSHPNNNAATEVAAA